MVVASKEMHGYFDDIQSRCKKEFSIASAARKKGYDPSEKVEVKLAANMAERVVGLISVIAPQIADSGVVERIIELEEKYGALDWRIALTISLEVAQEKFCKFKDQKEAIEVGVRVGFAYGTVGVVSSPLEGLITIDIKNRRDGKGEYFCLNYGGPVRNAGGTAAAWSVIIADYVRKNMGYAEYDPDEKEVKRCPTELEDYHERVTNLQYFPSKRESEFMIKSLPVEISGDASEKIEVSNYKDLPRIPTNQIRSGYCLIHSSCIPLKAEKLWKQLSKWGKDFGMEHWNFLEQFIKIKKEAHAAGGASEKKEESADSNIKVSPDYTYIKDLVAGRPVISHPLRNGGFRLRYGRSRTSGYSAQSIHPASMHVLRNFIATGTQLKVERPGKGAAFTPCDTIEGPIIKTKDGSVVKLDTEQKAKDFKKQIGEVLYLGDVLINYGDFLNRGHSLIPPGYCEEWWAQEIEKKTVTMFGSLDVYKLAELVNVKPEELERIIKSPLKRQPTPEAAFRIARSTNTPLHPKHSYFWNTINKEELPALVRWLHRMKIESDEKGPTKAVLAIDKNQKRNIELIGLPHTVASNEYVIFDKADAFIIKELFKIGTGDPEHIEKELQDIISDETTKDTVSAVNKISGITQRDKCGIFIGGRMGRPEKAKMRKLTGSPHVLFPVGEDGGRLRSFQSALEKGKITAEFATYKCDSCGKEVMLPVCPMCDKKARRQYHCRVCGPIDTETCPKHDKTMAYARRDVEIGLYFKSFLDKMKTKTFPDLIKGVRGTSNREHIPEHLMKGILRAKHDVCVNKEGTVRYDCSELPITHFKPKEIAVTVEKLKELGYTKDIKGRPLEDDKQILELKPQDIVIPCCPVSPDEPSDKVIWRICDFVDEELKTLYGLKPYFNIKTREDLAGQLIIGLAPHTSAGTLGRIIGFSKTQGFLAHPLMHAAMRRDCFSYDTLIPIKKCRKWTLIELGKLVEDLNPTDIVDDFGTREIKADGYETLGLKDNKITEVKVNNFTKHAPRRMIEIKTKLGRKIKTTSDHKHISVSKKTGKDKVVRASEIKKRDLLRIPYNLDIMKKDIKRLDLIDLFKECDWVMVHGLGLQMTDLRLKLRSKGLTGIQVNNYVTRDSVPIKAAYDIIRDTRQINTEKLILSAKRDHVKIPSFIPVDETFLKILGLYVAEGYSRKVLGNKGLYQVYIAAEKECIRSFVKNYFKTNMFLKPSENKKDRVTYSSRILYELFTSILCMGSSAHEKRMPNRFLNLPNKKLGWLLSGYLEGDGSVSTTDLRITFDTVSKGLLRDIDFMFGQMNIFVKNRTYAKEPGPKVREFYVRKGRNIPKFTCTKGIIQSKFMTKASEYIRFISDEKQKKLEKLMATKKSRNISLDYDDDCFIDEVTGTKILGEQTSYCLNVDNNVVVANGILTRQCDGDEGCILLLMDTFLNFSSKYLPDSRGSTMDAPLVLTSVLAPTEVDDMAFDVDRVWSYPLEFYEACLEYKKPWEVKLETIKNVLLTEQQYEGMGFTHDTEDINAGVLCSAYKTLPSMQDKLLEQMALAEKIRAVDEADVARLVIEKHFIRDIKGNLRKFSQQEFRCVNCNEKFRRPPLLGKCTACGGKIIFTISEGSIIKYLEPSISLANKYALPNFLKQSLELVKRRIEGVFGKEKEKQEGLGKWFG